MRVERDRVCVSDSGQRLAPALGEHRKPAVRSVHVEPEPVLVAEGTQLAERVDGAGVRGAGVRHDGERSASGPGILGHGRGDVLGP